jgi:hypothetical protein
LIDSGSTHRKLMRPRSLSRGWPLPLVLIGLAMLAAPVVQAGAAVPTGGRQWEMLTPRTPTPAHASVVRPMADDADRFVFSTLGPYPGSASGPIFSFLITQRGPTGWTNTPISFPYSISPSSEIFLSLIPIFPGAFSDDHNTAVWLSTVPLTPDAPAENEIGIYRKSLSGSPEFVARVARNGLTILYASEYFIDIGNDGRRIVFNTAEHLLPADAARTIGVSAYVWEAGDLQLLDVDEGGNLLSPCGARISDSNGMAEAADVVFFTTPECEGSPGKVYARDLDSDTTIELSASHCTRVDCNAAANARFVTATPDGRTAFLATGQQLTNDDRDEAPDFYRYDVPAGNLTLLSGGSAEASGEAVEGRVYPSDDATSVYFAGTGEMQPGESTDGEKLFVADSAGVHLISEVSLPGTSEFQVTRDGRRAVFGNQSQLVPDDTDTERDVYLYDADADSLTRVSTGSAGGNGPSGAAIFSPVENLGFQSSGNYEPFWAMDEAGERVFFSTAEALVPEDVNGKVDIYEWWNGETGLISSGTDPYDSGFAGASRDGRSVLFVTNGSLLPGDKDDGNRDFFVARLGGGFPEPIEEAPPCSLSPCPPAPRAPLARPAPPTMSAPAAASSRLRLLSVRSKRRGVVGRATTLAVAVPAPGPVSASVWVRERGERVVLARGKARAARPGRVRIELELTPTGRDAFPGAFRDGRVTVRSGAATLTRPVEIDLRQGRG